MVSVCEGSLKEGRSGTKEGNKKVCVNKYPKKINTLLQAEKKKKCENQPQCSQGSF